MWAGSLCNAEIEPLQSGNEHLDPRNLANQFAASLHALCIHLVTCGMPATHLCKFRLERSTPYDWHGGTAAVLRFRVLSFQLCLQFVKI